MSAEKVVIPDIFSPEVLAEPKIYDGLSAKAKLALGTAAAAANGFIRYVRDGSFLKAAINETRGSSMGHIVRIEDDEEGGYDIVRSATAPDRMATKSLVTHHKGEEPRSQISHYIPDKASPGDVLSRATPMVLLKVGLDDPDVPLEVGFSSASLGTSFKVTRQGFLTAEPGKDYQPLTSETAERQLDVVVGVLTVIQRGIRAVRL